MKEGAPLKTHNEVVGAGSSVCRGTLRFVEKRSKSTTSAGSAEMSGPQQVYQCDACGCLLGMIGGDPAWRYDCAGTYPEWY
jgi:hypothetical protein